MASFMRSLILNVITNSMSIICGILCIIQLFYMWLTLPSGSLTRRKKRPIPPACLNNPEFGNHSYVQVNNVKLHYVEKGDRTKPLMLFIHGFPEFWYSWRHQIKEFSKDYWVVAPDLRGYADSEKPDGIKYYKLRYLVEDIKNLVTAFEKEKVTVVGHDWGGVIVWYFLMLHPELIETYIVMNAPHPPTFRKHLSTSFSQFRKSWYIFFFKLPYLPEFVLSTEDYRFLNTIFHSKKKPSPFSEEDKEAFRFTFSKPGALTPPINYYRANLTPDSKIRKEIKSKKTKYPPGLLIFGEGDKFIDVESVKDTKNSVPNLTIEFVKDASHFVQQDDPETVNKLMRDFLEKFPELLKQEEAQQ